MKMKPKKPRWTGHEVYQASRSSPSESSDSGPKNRRFKKFQLLDVSRAHFHAFAKRRVWIRLPAEALRGRKDVVGLLLRCMYGTRDASALWEDTWLEELLKLGSKKGSFTICLLYDPVHDLLTFARKIFCFLLSVIYFESIPSLRGTIKAKYLYWS